MFRKIINAKKEQPERGESEKQSAVRRKGRRGKGRAGADVRHKLGALRHVDFQYVTLSLKDSLSLSFVEG